MGQGDDPSMYVGRQWTNRGSSCVFPGETGFSARRAAGVSRGKNFPCKSCEMSPCGVHSLQSRRSCPLGGHNPGAGPLVPAPSTGDRAGDALCEALRLKPGVVPARSPLSMAVVIALDAGTTGVRAMAVDAAAPRSEPATGSSLSTSPARVGRARRRRDLGGRGRHPGELLATLAGPSPPSASPTSARPRWCGIAAPAGLATAPSCGRTAAAPGAARSRRPGYLDLIRPVPAWSSTRTSRPPS